MKQIYLLRSSKCKNLILLISSTVLVLTIQPCACENAEFNNSYPLLSIWERIQSETRSVDSNINPIRDPDSANNSSQSARFIETGTLDNISKENTVRLLDYFRRRNREGECNPDTNIYPCGALDFLGCTGNKKFYAESVIRLNWFEAWEFCRNNDMHLASIESTYEQVFLELFLPKPESGAREGYWVSGTDFGREGLFYWMSNGKSFTFTNWNAREPNNYKGREHCVQMNSNLRNSDSLKWNDVPCNSVGYVICQEPYSRKFESAQNSVYDFVQERDNSHKQKQVVSLIVKEKPTEPTKSDDDVILDLDSDVENENSEHYSNNNILPPPPLVPPILSILAAEAESITQ